MPVKYGYYGILGHLKPFNGDIKTAEQRAIIQQYGDWYTGR